MRAFFNMASIFASQHFQSLIIDDISFMIFICSVTWEWLLLCSAQWPWCSRRDVR